MLNARMDSSNNSGYFDYIHPFVMHILWHQKNNNIDIDNQSVTRAMKEEFGLEIPIQTIQTILRKLVKSRQEAILVRENNQYKLIQDIPPSKLSEEKEVALEKITTVVRALYTYAQDKHNRNISEEMSSSMLTLFLEKFSIDCIRAFYLTTALPPLPAQDRENWQLVLVSLFVRYIHENDANLFEDFMTVVKGHMAANALLCPDLEQFKKSYSGVTFYFDVRLLLRVLGLDLVEHCESVIELIQLLQKNDGKIAYFSHTYDELMTAIDNAINYFDSPRGRGSIIHAARQSDKPRTDLMRIQAKARDLLEEKNLLYEKTPAYIQSHQIDEQTLENFLEKEVKYRNPGALTKDINSVRSIYVLRRGKEARSLETCKAILITNNTAFAKSAYQFGKDRDQSRDISTVMSDISLTNIAWLKDPVQNPNLPRKEVLAIAHAALQPSDEYVSKIIEEIDRLKEEGNITSEDHLILRSATAEKYLLSETLGEDVDLTQSAAKKVLEAVKKEMIQAADENVRNLQKRSELLESDNTLLGKKLELEKNRWYNFYEQKAKKRVWSKIIGGALVVLIAGVSLFLFNSNVIKNFPNIIRIISTTIAVAVLVFKIYLIIFKNSVSLIINKDARDKKIKRIASDMLNKNNSLND